MNIFHNDKHSFPFTIVDDLYTDTELYLIWEELKYISYPHKWDTPESHPKDGAVKNGEQLKKNNFRWLDSYYTNRLDSNILTINRKIFQDDMWDKIFLKHPNWFFNTFESHRDQTLISYYDLTDDCYKPHRDSTYVTCLTWFYLEPKKFNGGDLILYNGEDKIKISCLNNRMLVIPSRILHEVMPIIVDGEIERYGGRYCMAQFLTYSYRCIMPED